MNQPQEWTPEYVREIGGHYSIRQQRDKAIADAHNAALAEAGIASEKIVAQVIADEQEKSEKWHGAFKQAFETGQQIERERDEAKLQLAAERLKYTGDDYATMDDARNRILDLEHQLAAAVEAIECAEYAITHPDSNQEFALNALHYALAKIKEGK